MKAIVIKCILGVAVIVGLVALTVWKSRSQGSETKTPKTVFIITGFNEHGSITDTAFTSGVNFIGNGVIGCKDMDSGKNVEIPFKTLSIEDVTIEYNAQHRCLKCYEDVAQ